LGVQEVVMVEKLSARSSLMLAFLTQDLTQESNWEEVVWEVW